MELALAILALAVGAVLGLFGYDMRLRLAAERRLAEAEKAHKAATEELMKLHNRAVAEHAALMDRTATIEHMLANRKSESIVKRF